MIEYDDWLHKFNEIWKNKKAILPRTIRYIAGQSKTKTKKKGWQNIEKICWIWECCLFPNESNQSDTCIYD